MVCVIALLLVHFVGYNTECKNVHSVDSKKHGRHLLASRQKRGIVHGKFQWFSPVANPQHHNIIIN